MLTLTWGVGQHEMVLLREWLEQLPAEVVHSRPRLCLACTEILWAVTPQTMLEAWLNAAEATLTASLTTQTDQRPHLCHACSTSTAGAEESAWRGDHLSCPRAKLSTRMDKLPSRSASKPWPLLSADNIQFVHISRITKLWAYYASCTMMQTAAIQMGCKQPLCPAAGQTGLAISLMGATALYMIGAGRLHEAQRLTQQAIQLGTHVRSSSYLR